MKKIVFLIVILVQSHIFSQEKVDSLFVTPNGVNGFVVKEIPALSSEEIFKNLKSWAEYNIKKEEYSNFSEIENEFLEYEIFIINAFYLKQPLTSPTWSLKLNIQFRIKEGKARMDIKYLKTVRETPNTSFLNLKSNLFTFGFFNNKGEPKKREAGLRKQMNEILLSLHQEFNDAVEGKVDRVKSDW